AVARWIQSEHEAGHKRREESPTEEEIPKILPDVLRRLHAEQAEKLAEQAWINPVGEKQYLISDDELRSFYGLTIGQISHSHWWSVQKIEHEF
ncbi:MAG TPA: hypothetical protein VLA60_02610, partial [Nitrospirales bacterium]|nr:hypothetical protein [Nitrospirales bacterium]